MAWGIEMRRCKGVVGLVSWSTLNSQLNLSQLFLFCAQLSDFLWAQFPVCWARTGNLWAQKRHSWAQICNKTLFYTKNTISIYHLSPFAPNSLKINIKKGDR
jgi:hypothetical protein